MGIEKTAVLGKIGKKVKKSKKKEMSMTEEISDCKAVEAAEFENNLKFRVEDKKDKIYHMVHDGLTLNSDSYGNFDTECSDVLPPDEASSLHLNREYKEMEKKKKREVCGDVMLDQIFGGSEKKRAKKRKLGTGEKNDALNEETETNDRLSKGNSYGKNNEEQDVQHQLAEDESNVLSIHKTKKRVESKSAEKEDITKTKDTKDRDVTNKNRKMIGNEEDDSVKGKKNSLGGKNIENPFVDHDKVAVDKAKRKKRKTEKTKDMDGHANMSKHAETTNREKRKKIKSVESDTENTKPRQKRKKVRFADCIEVFPSSGVRNTVKVDDLIQGKRFTPEEDELVKAAVLDYIKSHDLGEKGLDMVMRCQSHPEVRKCWKDIGAFIPSRPKDAVYRRAHILFEGGERHKWTEEELDLIRKHQNKRQENCRNDWKGLAEELGLYRYRLSDTWRRIKLSNRNKGCWSQEEYQNLFNLVNKDLQMRTFKEKKSKHGMLRDNISWEEISGSLSTRSDANCCMKWYRQLTSSLVAEGKWADSDDYRLLDALFKLDACCIEDGNWDNLIDHRSGDLCRKRWDQMVLHIGLHQNKSFAEQVEILGKRYCPSLLEAKQIWDNKPVVP